MKFKIWIKKYFLCVLVCFVVIISANYTIDSYDIFINRQNEAAKAVLNGKSIRNERGGDDDRNFVSALIENLYFEPEYVILGSSTTMPISKDMIFGRGNSKANFLNYSATGGTLEDFIVWMRLHYKKFKKYPNNVLIGVSAPIFNDYKHNKEKRFTKWNKEYFEMLDILNIKEARKFEYNKYEKILSFDYFVKNIIFLVQNFNNYYGFYEVDPENFDGYIKTRDGSTIHPIQSRQPNEQEVKKLAINGVKNRYNMLQSKINHNAKKILEKFILHLKDNGVNIVICLYPFNPYAYDLFMKHPIYKEISILEKELNAFAEENNIEILGSYNPKKYNFTNKDFYDGVHLRPVFDTYNIIFRDFYKYDLKKKYPRIPK